MATIDEYLSGMKLYGDDFNDMQINEWFRDEQEGYSQLGSRDGTKSGTYGYHALNRLHGFRNLPKKGSLGNALGLGSAFGHEFLPISSRLDSLTIVEPSSVLRGDRVGSLQPRYVSPEPSGLLPFSDCTFELVVCLGTLHHIPNVTKVIMELSRVTTVGGWLLIREPIRSMGDWSQPRPGLTLRERGIPQSFMETAFEKSGISVVRAIPCMFPTTRRLASWGLGHNSPLGVRLDGWLARATVWNGRYHPTKPWQKVQPTSIFYVLQRL